MPYVYVVAWTYGRQDSNGGGGFEWFYTNGDAIDRFEQEKKTCEQNKDENWTAYRFNAFVGSFETASEKIDEMLGAYLDAAREIYDPNAEFDP